MAMSGANPEPDIKEGFPAGIVFVDSQTVREHIMCIIFVKRERLCKKVARCTTAGVHVLRVRLG